MGKRKVPDLYRAPFPLYAVKIDPKTGLIITAGGGGASKTGIKNAVHFLGLELVGGQHSATLLHSHDTGSCATMNMALGGDVIAAGQDGNCRVMRFRQQGPKEGRSAAPKDGSGEQGSARRRGAKSQNGGGSGGGDVPQTKDKTVQILVDKVGEVESDLSPQDPLQKCVRFSSDLKLLLTGGADGYVRVWEYPSLKEKLNFKAHQDEIEDIDISPDNKRIVTAGRDFACSIWSDDQLMLGLRWHDHMPHITEKMYRYQSCRFQHYRTQLDCHATRCETQKSYASEYNSIVDCSAGSMVFIGTEYFLKLVESMPHGGPTKFAKVEDQKDALRLYTVQIPHKRERKPPPCYLTKWDGRSFLPLLIKPCGNEVISCLSVSDSGTFLGLGTVTGSVSIYIAFSLQKLYYVQESHGIVVTDLAFLPDAPKSKAVKGNNEVAMLSVAVDSRCQLHTVANRRSVPIWLALFLCIALLVGVVLLLQHFFPGFI